MTIRALVILTDDRRAFVRSIKPELEDMQRLVGGWLEAIPVTDDAVMYLNEEGKLHALSYNETANKLMFFAPYRLVRGDYLVGNVVVVGTHNSSGAHDAEEHDVPRSVLDLCTRAGIEVVESAP